MITTFGLVTMIITAIFGFGNVSNAYLQMGYGSIIWYALAGICFFFPCGLMMAEYGSTFKDAKGGIYSWLAGSVGERIAFVCTFVWFSGPAGEAAIRSMYLRCRLPLCPCLTGRYIAGVCS